MTIAKDRVKPSPLPDSWKLREIFGVGVVLGTYMALMTVLFFWLMHETTFFPVHDTGFLLQNLEVYCYEIFLSTYAGSVTLPSQGISMLSTTWVLCFDFACACRLCS